MKKSLLIFAILVVTSVLLLIFTCVYLSYKFVRPQIKAFNLSLEDEFTKVVNIPRESARLSLSFNDVNYFWEMETTQNEVVGVIFRYNPDYLGESKEIVAKMEMAEGADASIFNKVLPALIIDPESLAYAQDKIKEISSVSLNKNYKDITVERNENNQATSVYWTFERIKIVDDSKPYSKLNNYPKTLLKILYEIPNTIVGLFAG
ncbi:hypothetical protein HY382_02650 [Candidatus Curtissbacteria bacterium]|nr:hypothetical protein [Candidatus Curtissbacteria bacterium]